MSNRQENPLLIPKRLENVDQQNNRDCAWRDARNLTLVAHGTTDDS